MKNKKINIRILFDKEWFMEQYNQEYTVEEDVVENDSQEEGGEIDTTEDSIQKEDDNTVDEVEQTEEQPLDNLASELEVDGVKYDEDSIHELIKNTSKKDEEINSLKTQLEEANQAVQFYNYLQSNPHIVEAMKHFDNPEIAKQFNENYPKLPTQEEKNITQLEERLAELELKNTLYDLHNKYDDFNDDEVLQYAVDKNILDLDVAYKALKSDKLEQEVKPDIETLKEQLRKEVLEEIKKEDLSTKSLISSKGNPAPQVKQFNLSPMEKKMAIEFGMTEEEYYNFSKN